ncbi:MAG: PAS domain-containing protein, partial [Actinobacteria bacterium]
MIMQPRGAPPGDPDPRAQTPSPRRAARPEGGGAVGSSMNYRGLLERIPAITYVAGFGEAGRWYYVSPQIERILGFSPGEWQADPELWFKQIKPEDRARALEEEATSKATGDPLCSEYRMMTRDGRTVWVRDEALLVVDAEATPQFWQGFMVD